MKILITLLVLSGIFLFLSFMGMLDVMVSEKYELDTYFMLENNLTIKEKIVEMVSIEERTIQLNRLRVNFMISTCFSFLMVMILTLSIIIKKKNDK